MIDVIAGTAIAWSILAAVAVMEVRDWRKSKNDEGRGAHPGRSSRRPTASPPSEPSAS